MRIGELAGLAGISTRAIRHYHHVGLLPEPSRKANGYREYSLRDAVELARVRRLTELGLSLDELADSPADDPRVEATAQAIVAAIPESARQAIRLPDGDLKETRGFRRGLLRGLRPAQAAAIRRAVDLMRQARRAGGPLDRRETTP
jgi:DNA-binding transcriptional MerR regulator